MLNRRLCGVTRVVNCFSVLAFFEVLVLSLCVLCD